MAIILKSNFEFLNALRENNNREWMITHKKEYLANEKVLKTFYFHLDFFFFFFF